MTYRVTTKLVAILLLTLPTFALAIDVSPPSDGGVEKEVTVSEDITTLKQVTVVGQAENSLTGSSVLADEVLRQLPKKNSSLTESITLLPRVQIGEEQRTSENAGEILPPLISISGGRPYENYYAVDGIGMNSLIDPLADREQAIDKVPGHPQRAFIHQGLIDSVTVHDSNIPARFGRFTGGVVDARTRMPSGKLGGNVSFRTTRDSWTEFHIGRDDRDDFNNSSNFNQQPRFKKYDGGIELDIPINDQMALLGSYKRIQSELELRHFEDWAKQDKTLESFFLKYVWTPQTPYTLELAATHTPSEEDFFIEGTKDSDFTIKRGGYSVNGIFSGDNELGSYKITAAYLENENTREAPSDFHTWRNTASKNWGEAIGLTRSREGGFGDIENTEKSVQIQTDFLSNRIATGELSHIVNFGMSYVWDQGEYDRKADSSVHSSATESDVVLCAPEDSACVREEQYFGKRNVYRAQRQDASINSVAGYLENLTTFGPLELRLGGRVSHDDFMNNTNVAYRTTGSWDILRNGKILLIGGYNRYYGESLLTYKLREAIIPYAKEVRSLDDTSNTLSEWSVDSLSTATRYKYSELDTPHSDEWTIGVMLQLFGGTLELNYLERENEDQFSKEKVTEVINGEDVNFYILNNNGSSVYESVKISWDRQWGNHYLNINYTHSGQDSSNESYDDTVDEEDLIEEIWYDGKVINSSDLPRLDYNREHMLNIIYTGKLPRNFTFTNITRYFGEYEARDKLSTTEKREMDIPNELTAYEAVTRPDYWVSDWRLDWEKVTHKSQSMVVSLEVNNVFNRTPPSGASDDTYELGRQFWLGMTYKF